MSRVSSAKAKHISIIWKEIVHLPKYLKKHDPMMPWNMAIHGAAKNKNAYSQVSVFLNYQFHTTDLTTVPQMLTKRLGQSATSSAIEKHRLALWHVWLQNYSRVLIGWPVWRVPALHSILTLSWVPHSFVKITFLLFKHVANSQTSTLSLAFCKSATFTIVEVFTHLQPIILQPSVQWLKSLGAV